MCTEIKALKRTLKLQCKHQLQMQSTELRLTISVKTFMYRCNSYMPSIHTMLCKQSSLS